jgi:hypothetical protein
MEEFKNLVQLNELGEKVEKRNLQVLPLNYIPGR